jgi:outer membrane protein assembly factor BamB
MRLRFLVPAVVGTLAIAGCASTAPDAARSQPPPSPHATVRAAVPARSDRVLIVANRVGTVSVGTATGAVAFRAPYGKAAPDSSTIVQAQPLDTGTRVVASDPLTGVPRWSHDVTGLRTVRVVSPGGRFVALVDGNLNSASQPRTTTSIDVVTARGTRRISVPGNLDPEAFSLDGRYLYALDFLPAARPSRYSVRRIDLGTLKTETVPDRDGSVRDPMPGYASTQLMSPDGRQLYTFYASQEPIHVGRETYHAWIHVLNLDKGWAHCVELDEKIGISGSANGALAVSPDGSRLFITDGTTGAFAAMDTTSLRVVRTRFIAALGNMSTTSLLATDGHTLFTRDGYGGLATVDATTLSTKAQTISETSAINALRLDGSGQTLYVLTTDRVILLDLRGHVIRRWASPGDATSIDPSVSVPGSGAYRCAC